MATYDKYNVKVGFKIGGDLLFVKEDGVFDFNDTQVTGKQMQLQGLSHYYKTNYISSVSVLALSILRYYGYAFFSAAAGCSKMSIKLPSALAGAILFLDFSQVASNAAMSILGNGMSLVDALGTNYSCIALAFSTPGAKITLTCMTENEWTITQVSGGGITPQASA